uniref:lipoprotein n=1 Tax=Mesoplasma chauliocola TaxID=216427 RepID=UPI0005613DA7
MKKLLAILGAVGVTATGASVVVACGNNNKEQKTNLSSIIIEKDLGKLEDAKEATVKAALLKANPTLKTDEIKLTITVVKAITTVNYNVIVEPKTDSIVYTGKVEGITFNTQTGVEDVKVVKSNVDAELAKLNKAQYETNEKAIAAIKAVDTDEFKVVSATPKTSTDQIREYKDQLFNVVVEAKTGYVLADDIKDGKTSITLSIGK